MDVVVKRLVQVGCAMVSGTGFGVVHGDNTEYSHNWNENGGQADRNWRKPLKFDDHDTRVSSECN